MKEQRTTDFDVHFFFLSIQKISIYEKSHDAPKFDIQFAYFFTHAHTYTHAHTEEEKTYFAF